MPGAPPTWPRRPLAGRAAARRAGFHLTPGQRVGLYGGSFNPVHEGHLHVAETALRRLGLDRIVWLVAPQNPLKAADPAAALAWRLARTRARLRRPRMAATDLERRIGTRYTVETVRWLKGRFPGVRFVWLMGADSLAGFHRWKGWADIARAVPILVVSRPETAIRSRFSPLARRFAAARRPEREAVLLPALSPPAWTYLAAPFHPVSSTALRESRLTGAAPRGKSANA